MNGKRIYFRIKPNIRTMDKSTLIIKYCYVRSIVLTHNLILVVLSTFGLEI